MREMVAKVAKHRVTSNVLQFWRVEKQDLKTTRMYKANFALISPKQVSWEVRFETACLPRNSF